MDEMVICFMGSCDELIYVLGVSPILVIIY